MSPRGEKHHASLWGGRSGASFQSDPYSSAVALEPRIMLDASIADAADAMAPSSIDQVDTTLMYVEPALDPASIIPVGIGPAWIGTAGQNLDESQPDQANKNDLFSEDPKDVELALISDEDSVDLLKITAEDDSADLGFALDVATGPAQVVEQVDKTIRVRLPEGQTQIGTIQFTSGKVASFALADAQKANQDGFSLDSKSGLLQLVEPKDYDSGARRFVVDIEVQDGEAEKNIHTIIVEINNVDEVPTWVMAPTGGALHALSRQINRGNQGYILGQGVRGTLGNLRALDPEGSSQIRYGWADADSQNRADQMGINLAANGTLAINDDSARAAGQTFALNIVASAGDGPSSLPLSLNFVVPDGNAISLMPALSGVRLDTGVYRVDEGRTTIGSLSAASDHSVVWSVAAGFGNQHFQIIEGELSLRSPLDFESEAITTRQGQYTVKVMASSAGIISEKIFNIAVANVDEAPQTFALDIDGEATFRSENDVYLISSNVERIGTLTALEPEVGILRFGLVDAVRSDGLKFSVEAGTGVLSLARISDPSTIPPGIVTVAVYVEDAGKNRTQMNVSFQVYNGPSLEKLHVDLMPGVKYETVPYHLSLGKSSEDQNVLQLSMEDAQSSTPVTFALRSGGDSDRFYLIDGDLSLKGDSSRDVETLRIVLEARQQDRIMPIPLVIDFGAAANAVQDDTVKEGADPVEEKSTLRMVLLVGQRSGDTFRIPENTEHFLRIQSPGIRIEDWRIEGADRDTFTIEADGALGFKNPPDFEMDRATDDSHTYRIRIATEHDGQTIMQNLVVIIGNVDEMVVPSRDSIAPLLIQPLQPTNPAPDDSAPDDPAPDDPALVNPVLSGLPAEDNGDEDAPSVSGSVRAIVPIHSTSNPAVTNLAANNPAVNNLATSNPAESDGGAGDPPAGDDVDQKSTVLNPYTPTPITSLGNFSKYSRHEGQGGQGGEASGVSKPLLEDEEEEENASDPMSTLPRGHEIKEHGKIRVSRIAFADIPPSPLQGWSSVQVRQASMGDDGVLRAKLDVEGGKKVYLSAKPLIHQLRESAGLEPDMPVSIDHQEDGEYQGEGEGEHEGEGEGEHEGEGEGEHEGESGEWMDYRSEDDALVGNVPDTTDTAALNFHVQGESGETSPVALEFSSSESED